MVRFDVGKIEKQKRLHSLTFSQRLILEVLSLMKKKHRCNNYMECQRHYLTENKRFIIVHLRIRKYSISLDIF